MSLLEVFVVSISTPEETLQKLPTPLTSFRNLAMLSWPVYRVSVSYGGPCQCAFWQKLHILQ